MTVLNRARVLPGQKSMQLIASPVLSDGFILETESIFSHTLLSVGPGVGARARRRRTGGRRYFGGGGCGGRREAVYGGWERVFGIWTVVRELESTPESGEKKTHLSPALR